MRFFRRLKTLIFVSLLTFLIYTKLSRINKGIKNQTLKNDVT